MDESFIVCAEEPEKKEIFDFGAMLSKVEPGEVRLFEVIKR
jgi:hypothetical protein